MAAFFVTGTDTDAGKTAVTAGLLRAFARAGVPARAVKPVQTGCVERAHGLEAPDVEVWNKAGGEGKALYAFRLPCSPHLAARLEGARLDASSVAEACRASVAREGVTLFEGAGGLYVPLNERESMLDLMRELRFPALLVVANRLGCLNHALLSLDALERAGVRVAGMVLCRVSPPGLADAGTSPEAESLILQDNAVSLEREGEKRGVPLLADIPYQARHDPDDAGFWDALADRLQRAAFTLAGDGDEKNDAEALLAFDRAHLWHPYSSAMKPLPALEVTGAAGARLFLRDGRSLVDGMSSWWCRVHGYGNPRLVRALQRQAATLSHVMFGGLTHKPAVELCRRLLRLLPSGLEHVFLADSGSVAVEVAMKMALQFWQAAGREKKRRFVALRGAYHGDTLGAMSLCDPVTGMHALFSGALPEQIFVERPTCRFDRPYDPATFASMEATLRERADEVAAVVVEPVAQGAGGMWFYHPGYLRDLRALCDELGVLLIADEIATGFGRTGCMFACEWAGVSPDVMCVGKALTGGMMTLSAVAATRRVAEVISGADASRGGGAFMHGPTFMGNPLACAVACASLDELCASPWRDRVRHIQETLERELTPCRAFSGLTDVRVLGAIGVVEMASPVDVEAWQDFFVSRGAWIRPFGRTVYVMPPFVISDEELRMLTEAVRGAVASAASHGGTPVSDGREGEALC
ncbi:adenosylmethionine--8-amino-7-oxononanoate transaminase [Mailhella sp.]|uniref:adenosylmethionine--8-amino-7-oxononanoate transaminase n=1 Tax=Mailhella sp. TaxID=1981029 RepID=UPI003AB7BA8A